MARLNFATEPRDADKRLFLSQVPDGAARQDFEKHGWTSPLNAARIAAFWEEMSPGLFTTPDSDGGEPR
ncbi:MAG: hypothetical protein ABJO35_08410 [Nitratireductor sp.]